MRVTRSIAAADQPEVLQIAHACMACGLMPCMHGQTGVVCTCWVSWGVLVSAPRPIHLHRESLGYVLCYMAHGHGTCNAKRHHELPLPLTPHTSPHHCMRLLWISNHIAAKTSVR